MHDRGYRSLQVRCEVAATIQKLAASSFVFVAVHLWMQGVPKLHIALDMVASAAVALWLCPAVAAFAEVLPLWQSTLVAKSSGVALCEACEPAACRGRAVPSRVAKLRGCSPCCDPQAVGGCAVSLSSHHICR